MRYKAEMFSVRPLSAARQLILLAAAMPVTVWSIPGDVLYVAGEFAVVREEPYGGAAVVAKIDEGQTVLEIRRQGNWLNVGVLGAGVTGWIHLSFLSASQGAGRRSQPLIPPMRRFEPVFDAFNRSMQARDGEAPFLSAAQGGTGILVVKASPAWWSKPLAERQNDLKSLHQMWEVANEQLPVTVVVTDTEGKRRFASG